jgi:hypothetical protein
MKGSTITNTDQPAFPQPPMSWRPKRSPKTMKSSQKNMIQAKNTSIVHITWPNVYASTASS